MACDETNSLDKLISLATRLDNRLRERRRERFMRQSTSSSATAQLSVPTSAFPAPHSQPNSDGEELTQLGRANLAPAERQR